MTTARWKRLAGAFGILALVPLLAGIVPSSQRAAAAYLVAYLAVLSVVLGVLAMTMIAHLTTATWFAGVRRRAEAVIGALPVLWLLAIPMLLGVLVLRPPVRGLPAPQRLYLNEYFLLARAVVYWVAWLVIGESLLAASRVQRRGDVARAARRFRITSSAGLIVLALTMTFAAFDWMMSLTPGWSSTAFGVYWFAGGLAGALALLALLARPSPSTAKTGLDRESAGRGASQPADRVQSIGKLLLTVLLFWVYVGFAQYIVIWSGNIPQEITWFFPRARRPWGWLALAMLLGTAVVFLALLIRRLKRSWRALACVGVLVLLLHYIDTYWMVLPRLVPGTWGMVLLSVVLAVLVAGATALVAAARIQPRAPQLE